MDRRHISLRPGGYLVAEHLIRNLDGTIAARSTYGHDPRKIRG